MTAKTDTNPAIARLTPFPEALAAVKALARPVTPREIAAGDAIGHVLAADVTVAAHPARPIALRDGYAVTADEIADAGGYAPVLLGSIPPRVEAGDEMPEGDAVAPVAFITWRDGRAEAASPVTRGDGMLRAGGNIDADKPLRKSGACVRATDIAIFAAAEVMRVAVRVPRIRIICAREDLRLLPAAKFIADDCRMQGGDPLAQNGSAVAQALRRDDADAFIVVGGTGSGERDDSVHILAQAGQVAVHGVGLTPGETAAIGSIGTRPVLAVPGRLDAALAVWLTLGRPMLARLAGRHEEENGIALALSRKVTSTVGLAEFVPVRRVGATAEPLGTKFLPFSALADADGWLLVPPDSEGYAAGAKVTVKPLP